MYGADSPPETRVKTEHTVAMHYQTAFSAMNKLLRVRLCVFPYGGNIGILISVYGPFIQRLMFTVSVIAHILLSFRYARDVECSLEC